jgi:hypothetical protein
MKENDIDRVNIAVFDGTETLHKNEFSLCNLNKPLKQKSNHFTPTDCNSTIWNKRSFLNFLNIFPNEKYNSFDLNQDIINYCKSICYVAILLSFFIWISMVSSFLSQIGL